LPWKKKKEEEEKDDGQSPKAKPQRDTPSQRVIRKTELEHRHHILGRRGNEGKGSFSPIMNACNTKKAAVTLEGPSQRGRQRKNSGSAPHTKEKENQAPKGKRRILRWRTGQKEKIQTKTQWRETGAKPKLLVTKAYMRLARRKREGEFEEKKSPISINRVYESKVTRKH